MAPRGFDAWDCHPERSEGSQRGRLPDRRARFFAPLRVTGACASQSMAACVALAVSLMLCSIPALADISVRASVNPQRAQVGEPLTLLIDTSGAQDVSAPVIGNISGFDVRYVGPATQISFVNGRLSASVQHRYSLLPLQAGHFTLGPFTVDYQGKQYQTASFAVDIVAAGQPQAQAPSGQSPPAQSPPGQGSAGRPPQSGAARGQAASGATPHALRLALSTSRQEVYLHERLPVDVTLYVGSIRVGDVQYPTLPGEGLSIDKFPEPSQRQQVIDGETFQVLHFQTTVVPLRAGSVALGPAALQLNVLNRRRGMFSDPFFERFFEDDAFSSERRPLELRSDPVMLTVLPLPEVGKPATFSGAVGTFTMQVTASPTELNAGDPITLRMVLTGNGNLGDSAPPALSNTDGFRIYEPHAGKSDGAASITKSYEQVLIPNDAAVRTIPPVRFSYFDPQARSYQTVESQPIALVVRPAQNVGRTDIVVGAAGGARAPAEEKLGRDIVYIKDDAGHLAARTDRWYGGLPFLLWQPLPLLLFVAAVWYDRRRQRLSGDIRYARFTRAGKEARRGLATASQALARHDRQTFYDTVSRTMQAYLAAKLDLPLGGIDAEAVSGRGVSHECAQRIRDFFATCEQVRFAPSTGDGDMRGTLALAQNVIKRLERERRVVANHSPGFQPAAPASDRTGTAAMLLVALLCSTIARAAEPASPQTTFFHANALYKDGRYAAAAQEYEQLLHSGLESGNLYFNLGNAYFKASEKGKAILNYERARRLMPRDPDVQANLAYAQGLTGVDACVASVWQRLAFPLARRVATSRLVWGTSVLYTLLLVALAAYRLWLQRPRWLLYVSTSLAVVLVVATTSLAQQVLVDDWQQQAVIVESGETPARFEPADSGTVHFVLKEGALVRVLDRRPGWLQIARCDGRRGWISVATAAEL